MPQYKYLIVGGGMTADAAVQGIRQVDHEGSIGLIGAEAEPPYNRPPLTKGLWKGKNFQDIWRKAASRDATLHLGRTAAHLYPSNNCVTDDQETVYYYEKLLLATGGTPQQLPGDSSGVLYFRTVNDYSQLRLLADKNQRFVVIGGGFIGSELAAALCMDGKQVVMVFPEQGIGARMFPSDLALFLNKFYRDKGVEVRNAEQVARVAMHDSQLAVTLTSDRSDRQPTIIADAVVAGLGIRPNVELAQEAGLDIGNGIRIDGLLRTSRPNIYAAGDVAEFFNPALGHYLRVEHEDNANTMGEMAGRSMAGEPVYYDHLPYFYSDLFELGYEAVGDVDPRLEIAADWKEPFREGVIYYLRKGRVRGVLLWNVWQRVDAARQLIAEAGPFRAMDLKGRLLESPQHA